MSPKVTAAVRAAFYQRLAHFLSQENAGTVTQIPEGIVVSLDETGLDVVVKVVVKKERVDVDTILAEAAHKAQEKEAREVARAAKTKSRELAKAAKVAMKELKALEGDNHDTEVQIQAALDA